MLVNITLNKLKMYFLVLLCYINEHLNDAFLNESDHKRRE